MKPSENIFEDINFDWDCRGLLSPEVRARLEWRDRKIEEIGMKAYMKYVNSVVKNPCKQTSATGWPLLSKHCDKYFCQISDKDRKPASFGFKVPQQAYAGFIERHPHLEEKLRKRLKKHGLDLDELLQYCSNMTSEVTE